MQAVQQKVVASTRILYVADYSAAQIASKIEITPLYKFSPRISSAPGAAATYVRNLRMMGVTDEATVVGGRSKIRARALKCAER